jgi:integrase
VSKRLGHANVYVTATVYAHALTIDETAAAEKWETAMKRASSKVIKMPVKKQA